MFHSFGFHAFDTFEIIGFLCRFCRQRIKLFFSLSIALDCKIPVILSTTIVENSANDIIIDDFASVARSDRKAVT